MRRRLVEYSLSAEQWAPSSEYIDTKRASLNDEHHTELKLTALEPADEPADAEFGRLGRTTAERACPGNLTGEIQRWSSRRSLAV